LRNTNFSKFRELGTRVKKGSMKKGWIPTGRKTNEDPPQKIIKKAKNPRINHLKNYPKTIPPEFYTESSTLEKGYKNQKKKKNKREVGVNKRQRLSLGTRHSFHRTDFIKFAL